MADPTTPRSKDMAFLTYVTVMAAMVIMSATVTAVPTGDVSATPATVATTTTTTAGSGSSFDFADVDVDGSGCIEGEEEMQHFRLYVGRILGEALHLGDMERALRAGRIAHSADINGDGRICECDLLSILVAETDRPGKHRHAFRVFEDGSIFNSLDVNSDGILDDVTEQTAMTKLLAKCVTDDKAHAIVDAIARLEKDDGKMTLSEYLMFLRSPGLLTSSNGTPLPHQPLISLTHNPQLFNPLPTNPMPIHLLSQNPQPFNPLQSISVPVNSFAHNPQPFQSKPSNSMLLNPFPHNPRPFPSMPLTPVPVNPQPNSPLEPSSAGDQQALNNVQRQVLNSQTNLAVNGVMNRAPAQSLNRVFRPPRPVDVADQLWRPMEPMTSSQLSAKQQKDFDTAPEISDTQPSVGLDLEASGGLKITPQITTSKIMTSKISRDDDDLESELSAPRQEQLTRLWQDGRP